MNTYTYIHKLISEQSEDVVRTPRTCCSNTQNILPICVVFRDAVVTQSSRSVPAQVMQPRFREPITSSKASVARQLWRPVSIHVRICRQSMINE